MRRLASVTIPLAVLCLSAMSAYAQERSVELQRFEFWIGMWGDTAGGAPIQECSWVGESFVQCTVFGAEQPVSTIHVFGYDADAEAYTAFRFYGNGFHDTGMGWVEGNTWTIVYADNPGRIIRWTGIQESEDMFSYRWERSVEGGEWVEASAGRAYRIK